MRDMLVNAVSTIERVSPVLERVVLVTGTKYYGSHLGPFRTPARESDPRHFGPNFYFDQIDWLTSFQKGKRWNWTELRPQTLCGFSPGTAMSIVSVIAVYAVICKEQGLPLRFPGKPGAYRSIYQVTESAHMAESVLRAATGEGCANEAFNITNGDYFRHVNTKIEMSLRNVETVRMQALGYVVLSPAGLKVWFGQAEPLGDQSALGWGNARKAGVFAFDTKTVVLNPMLVVDFAETFSGRNKGLFGFRNSTDVDVKTGISLRSGPGMTHLGFVARSVPIEAAIAGGNITLKESVIFRGDFGKFETREQSSNRGLVVGLGLLGLSGGPVRETHMGAAIRLRRTPALESGSCRSTPLS